MNVKIIHLKERAAKLMTEIDMIIGNLDEEIIRTIETKILDFTENTDVTWENDIDNLCLKLVNKNVNLTLLLGKDTIRQIRMALQWADLKNK